MKDRHPCHYIPTLKVHTISHLPIKFQQHQPSGLRSNALNRYGEKETDRMILIAYLFTFVTIHVGDYPPMTLSPVGNVYIKANFFKVKNHITYLNFIFINYKMKTLTHTDKSVKISG